MLLFRNKYKRLFSNVFNCNLGNEDIKLLIISKYVKLLVSFVFETIF